jgi:hypothetical protein
MRDMEILRGTPFTTTDIQAGIEPRTYIGTKVEIVVVSKTGPGGKPKFIGGPFTKSRE